MDVAVVAKEGGNFIAITNLASFPLVQRKNTSSSDTRARPVVRGGGVRGRVG